MPAPFQWDRHVAVPPKATLAWWWDYQEGPHDHASPAHEAAQGTVGTGPGRSILSRAPESVTFEDTWEGHRWRWELRLRGERIEGTLDVGRALGDMELSLAPEGNGTRLTFLVTFKPKGLGHLLFPLQRARLYADLRADLEAHAAHLESDWKTSPW